MCEQLIVEFGGGLPAPFAPRLPAPLRIGVDECIPDGGGAGWLAAPRPGEQDREIGSLGLGAGRLKLAFA